MSAPAKKSKPSYQIDDLSLHPNVIQKLKEANLHTFKRILHLSINELQKIAKLSVSEAQGVIDAVSLTLLESESLSAHDLSRRGIFHRKLLHFNILKSANNAFSGLYTGTVTEICGESGCGKTQLCLHLSILAQLPIVVGGLNSKVIYIHSEGEFPIRRFMQLASIFKGEHPEMQAINLSNNLILRQVHNLNALMHVLQNGIPDLVKKSNPKLLVIDSVASVLRSDFESVSSRTSTMQNFGAEIKKLADVFGMVVICVNQVSGHTSKNETTGTSYLTNVPSLGLLWSNVLTTRLKISRKISPTGQIIRVLECIYSTYHPRMAINFVISETGVKII